MNVEKFESAVLARIAKGHPHVLKKAVPKKKSPTGKAIQAVKEMIPSCSSKQLFSKAMQKFGSIPEIESHLGKMRDAGVIHCANGMWWKR